MMNGVYGHAMRIFCVVVVFALMEQGLFIRLR